jgi:hypothetical protein
VAALLLAALVALPGTAAPSGPPALHLIGRHSPTPIAIRVEVPPAQRASHLPRLGRRALIRVADRLAWRTAELRATGGTQSAVDGLTDRTITRTRCRVVNRVFMVPRGFVDAEAIDDRIAVESSFHGASLTRVAEWAVQPSGRSAPLFGRVIAVVFLSACPPPRS